LQYDFGGKATRKEATGKKDIDGRIIFEWILEN
jgi:hypothetical protein